MQKKSEQLSFTKEENEILLTVYTYFSDKKHSFEGLASFIATLVLGKDYTRGWATRKSGDGGIDFIGRLEIGNHFSYTAVVVLGQAKCIKPDSSISGENLARVVARLQRGWIGIYVTTGYFSEKARQELFNDKYPVILINGKRLARELKIIMNLENISLKEILERETGWYETNQLPIPPEKILEIDTGKGFSAING